MTAEKRKPVPEDDYITIPRKRLAELLAAEDRNAELVEALDQLITVTAHLDPCPGTVAIAREALAKVEP